jgi:putative NADPH-quinone reductase
VKTLFIVAHPHLEGSRANRRIVEAVKKVPDLSIHDLYSLYPDFHIPRHKEQNILMNFDLIVWQHPLLWYGMPPLLKLWLDEVLEQGFAFGEGGTALKGKKLLLSITTGGAESSYQSGATNLAPISDYLLPYRATANLCGMEWLSPRVFHHARRATDEQLEAFVTDFVSQLTQLCGK